MNVSRRCTSGEVVESESLNQSQLYITTAGYKNTYSYNKLIQLLIRMVIEPEKAFVLGGSWRIPVLLGLQNKSFIEDLKKDQTFNEASFGREYKQTFVFFKLLRIAGKPLELFKLQHMNEIYQSANV